MVFAFILFMSVMECDSFRDEKHLEALAQKKKRDDDDDENEDLNDSNYDEVLIILYIYLDFM